MKCIGCSRKRVAAEEMGWREGYCPNCLLKNWLTARRERDEVLSTLNNLRADLAMAPHRVEDKQREEMKRRLREKFNAVTGDFLRDMDSVVESLTSVSEQAVRDDERAKIADKVGACTFPKNAPHTFASDVAEWIRLGCKDGERGEP